MITSIVASRWYAIIIAIMKKQIIITLLLALISTFSSASDEPVLSQEINGVHFSIVDVDRGERLKKRYHMQNDWIQNEAVSAEGVEIDYIAITYQLLNANPNKKINLDKSFQFHLLDEFENQYLKIPKPDSYDQPIMVTDKHFPSVYPNETFKETVFFEAPISTSKRLTFLIKASPLGEAKVAKLIIPVEKSLTVAIPEVQNQLKAQGIEVPVQTDSIVGTSRASRSVSIVFPATWTPINRGDPTQLHVSVSGNPDLIIVAALGTTFQDKNPQSENVYDLRIPFGYHTGPMNISVIAQWENGLEEPFILSDSIFMEVQSPYRFLEGMNEPVLEYFK